MTLYKEQGKSSFKGSQGLIWSLGTSQMVERCHGSYPLEEGEHYIPLQQMNIWCFVKGFSSSQVGHKRGDSTLCPGCNVPEEGMAVNLEAQTGGVRNVHTDRGIEHWTVNLSPHSYPPHPTSKGRTKAPCLMKLKIPTALLWQSWGLRALSWKLRLVTVALF